MVISINITQHTSNTGLRSKRVVEVSFLTHILILIYTQNISEGHDIPLVGPLNSFSIIIELGTMRL